MTVDSDRLFNGSPERYNWKLVGKKEMYIPANALRLVQPTVKYKDLLTPHHPNPEFLRYELRRVWVIEGTLKEGYRHIYGKRVMYADEDTGQAVLSDMYDARGQLWQHASVNMYYSYDLNAWHAGTSFYHDLNANSYLAYTLFQERPKGPVLNRGGMTPSMFTPKPLATPATKFYQPAIHHEKQYEETHTHRSGRAAVPGHGAVHAGRRLTLAMA